MSKPNIIPVLVVLFIGLGIHMTGAGANPSLREMQQRRYMQFELTQGINPDHVFFLSATNMAVDHGLDEANFSAFIQVRGNGIIADRTRYRLPYPEFLAFFQSLEKHGLWHLKADMPPCHDLFSEKFVGCYHVKASDNENHSLDVTFNAANHENSSFVAYLSHTLVGAEWHSLSTRR